MKRLDQAKAWAALARERLDKRDPLASQALDVARALYAAVPEHDLAKAKPEEIIAGALLEFARAHAEAERVHTEQAGRAAVEGALLECRRVFDKLAQSLQMKV